MTQVVHNAVIPAPEPGAAPLIDVRGLTKSYGATHALDQLDLALPAGRIVGLMGPNGCGKTTLLKILAGVLSGWSGEVRVCGERPGPASKAQVSFLPDADFLPRSITPSQAIAWYRRFFADFDADKAERTMEFFGLPMDRQLKAMSKGMGEKVQIALCMARRAKVYLLDEPLSGVDPAARDVIMAGILREFDPDGLMVVSTHLISEIESLVDSVVFLRSGQVLLAGDADDLRAEHAMTLDALFRKEYR